MDPSAAEDLALLTPRGVRILLSAGNYLLYGFKIAATELTLFGATQHYKSSVTLSPTLTDLPTGAYFVLVAAALYSIA